MNWAQTESGSYVPLNWPTAARRSSEAEFTNPGNTLDLCTVLTGRAGPVFTWINKTRSRTENGFRK